MPQKTRRPHAPIAKSFYTRLTREGFTHQQVVALATELIDLVHRDLREEPPVAQAK
jgi:hypothetical protein